MTKTATLPSNFSDLSGAERLKHLEAALTAATKEARAMAAYFTPIGAIRATMEGANDEIDAALEMMAEKYFRAQKDFESVLAELKIPRRIADDVYAFYMADRAAAGYGGFLLGIAWGSLQHARDGKKGAAQ